MSGFLGELEGLTDRISCIREHLGPDERERRQAAGQLLPAFRLEREDVDLMHYPELKRKYKIMSVPCMVINDTQVYFGRKSLEEVTELLWKA